MNYRIISLSALLLVAACGGSTQPSMPTPSPMSATVSATPGLAFTPGTTTIAPNGTVTFAFGSVGHNVYFDATTGAPADIAGTNANVNVGRTFATAGTYVYHCHIHPSMMGTIVVAPTSMGNGTNGGSY
ncbi:MAG: plastocyanin/azurin family copper-binding protein [Gemmatimonadota bacterium]|nr:plastocyanin/azurin family copper-binding protein [Gemmatimonadota bacterium]